MAAEVPLIEVQAIHMLGLAGVGILIGEGILRAIPALARLSVPRAILGGLVLAFIVVGLRDRVVNFNINTELRDLLMVAFFITVGLGASFRLLRIGGLGVVIFLGASVLGLVLQIVFGAAASYGLGMSPLFGLIPGAISLTGGPATSLAFGPQLEALGVEGATTAAVASAMLGIVVSGVVGGYIGSYLIRRDNLKSSAGTDTVVEIDVDSNVGERHGSVLAHLITIGIIMAAGVTLSGWISNWAPVPVYIGAMVLAVLVRNLDDAYQFIGLEQKTTQTIGDIALELFIVMAMIALKMWQIVGLAGPVLIIFAGQVIMTVGLAWTLVYWLMGRSYTAAVMAGGYTGFMLGTTANAVASMNAIVKRSGPAPHAFLAVGIVGAFLIDAINVGLLGVAINLLK